MLHWFDVLGQVLNKLTLIRRVGLHNVKFGSACEVCVKIYVKPAQSSGCELQWELPHSLHGLTHLSTPPRTCFQ